MRHDEIGWEWCDLDLINSEGQYDSNEPVKVGALRGEGTGRNVFVNRIPAWRASSVHPHLVAQRGISGELVVRRLHDSEVDRLFAGLEGFEWGPQRGESAPPVVAMQVLEVVRDFLRPQSMFVPKDIAQIISEKDTLAFRGSLMLAEKDFAELKKRGMVDQTPGQANAKSTGSHKMVQQKGGYAFTDCVPDVGAVGTCWYLADYWRSLNSSHWMFSWAGHLWDLNMRNPVPEIYRVCTPMFRETAAVAPQPTVVMTEAAFWRVMRRLCREAEPVIQYKKLGNHAFRVDSMNVMVAMGASPMMVAAKGRWASDCFLLYGRTQKVAMEDYTRRMVEFVATAATY